MKGITPTRRILTSFLVAALMFMAPLSSGKATAADYYWEYIIEGTWYKSYSTCRSRAIGLVLTGEYRGPYNCRQDSLSAPNDRWTLRIYKKVYYAGGGGGGWAAPNR